MNKILKDKINFLNIAIISVIAIFFVLDRYLKNLALKLSPGESVNLIADFFSFSFTKNPYIAFSLPLSSSIITPLVVAIIISLIVVIIRLIYKQKHLSLQVIFLIIILLGAVSNAIDRLQYAYVIDYLRLKNLSVFNIADAMISLGTMLYIYTSFIKEDSVDKIKKA